MYELISGSLRIIRNGIGIQEQATIDLPGIKGIWQLKVGCSLDNVLVISFVGQTKVLLLQGEEVEELNEFKGFIMDQQTLFCGNINDDTTIVQVTSSCIRLIDEKQMICEWKAQNDVSIVTCNSQQIVCAARDELCYLTFERNEIIAVNSAKMEHEIACVDINPLNGNRSDIVAVGLWNDISVR